MTNINEARRIVLDLELRAVRAARVSNNLDVARAAIEREEELARALSELGEAGSPEETEEAGPVGAAKQSA